MLKAIAKWCDENECLLISDDLPRYLVWSECTSVVQFSDQNIAVGSFSYYSMTGAMVAVVPTELVRPVECYGNLNLSAPTLSRSRRSRIRY